MFVFLMTFFSEIMIFSLYSLILLPVSGLDIRKANNRNNNKAMTIKMLDASKIKKLYSVLLLSSKIHLIKLLFLKCLKNCFSLKSVPKDIFQKQFPNCTVLQECENSYFLIRFEKYYTNF